ncbi:MAG: hypothetical protein U0V73_10055 [Acidimicrobiia bacterium]
MTSTDATAAPVRAVPAPSVEGRRDRRAESPSGRIAFAVVVAGWIGILGMLLALPLFVSHDSVSNYAHVWFLAKSLWHGHGVPFHIPLAGGAAYTFPYGFFPWMFSALLWPLFGEWSVTLALVLGSVGLGFAMFAAFPELGRGWWAAAALVNPCLVVAVINAQLPFVWAMAFAFVAIMYWRRGRPALAALFAAMAQLTHVVVLFPILLVLVLVRAFWEPEPKRLLKWYALSTVVVVPAAALVLASPVYEATAAATKAFNLADTILPRAVLLLVPLVVLGLQHLRGRLRRDNAWLPVAGFVVALLCNAVFAPAFDTEYAWAGLRRVPDRNVSAFTKSKAFVPGRTYRVLRRYDGKVGMYEYLKAGAKLDSEFFPEGFAHRSFRSLTVYSKFLRKRRVDVVVVYRSYDDARHDEHQLLDDLAARRRRGCSEDTVGVRVLDRGSDFTAYAIDRACGGSS